MISCLFCCSRFSPGLLNYVVLALSDCFHGSQFQSSPWSLVWSLKHEPQHPDPIHCSKCAYKHLRLSSSVCNDLCAELSLLCFPCTYCCTPLWGPKVPSILICEAKFPPIHLPPFRASPAPIPLSPLFFLFLFPNLFTWRLLTLLEVWGLLPAFSKCYVGAASCADVFLMYLWAASWSPCLTPSPSWKDLPTPDTSYHL